MPQVPIIIGTMGGVRRLVLEEVVCDSRMMSALPCFSLLEHLGRSSVSWTTVSDLRCVLTGVMSQWCADVSRARILHQSEVLDRCSALRSLVISADQLEGMKPAIGESQRYTDYGTFHVSDGPGLWVMIHTDRLLRPGDGTLEELTVVNEDDDEGDLHDGCAAALSSLLGVDPSALDEPPLSKLVLQGVRGAEDILLSGKTPTPGVVDFVETS
jgi:hypothetical protein